jgi:hypothetical protein
VGAKRSGYFLAMLDDPTGGGMMSDVEMNNLSPVMANNKEGGQ